MLESKSGAGVLLVNNETGIFDDQQIFLKAQAVKNRLIKTTAESFLYPALFG